MIYPIKLYCCINISLDYRIIEYYYRIMKDEYLHWSIYKNFETITCTRRKRFLLLPTHQPTYNNRIYNCQVIYLYIYIYITIPEVWRSHCSQSGIAITCLISLLNIALYVGICLSVLDSTLVINIHRSQ